MERLCDYPASQLCYKLLKYRGLLYEEEEEEEEEICLFNIVCSYTNSAI